MKLSFFGLGGGGCWKGDCNVILTCEGVFLVNAKKKQQWVNSCE